MMMKQRFEALLLPLVLAICHIVNGNSISSSEAIRESTRRTEEGTCSEGNRGNGLCPNPKHCCSSFGYCGLGDAYCNQPADGPLEDDADLSRYCGQGNGVANGLCVDPTQCCSKWGFCGNTKYHCDEKNLATEEQINEDASDSDPTNGQVVADQDPNAFESTCPNNVYAGLKYYEIQIIVGHQATICTSSEQQEIAVTLKSLLDETMEGIEHLESSQTLVCANPAKTNGKFARSLESISAGGELLDLTVQGDDHSSHHRQLAWGKFLYKGTPSHSERGIKNYYNDWCSISDHCIYIFARRITLLVLLL